MSKESDVTDLIKPFEKMKKISGGFMQIRLHSLISKTSEQMERPEIVQLVEGKSRISNIKRRNGIMSKEWI